MDIHDVVNEIKQSFRLMMDGAVAQSMRDKGLNYHLNWGATLPRLQAKAEEIRLLVIGSRLLVNDSSLPTLHSSLYDLSIALYKENVRECKILASMRSSTSGRNRFPPRRLLSNWPLTSTNTFLLPLIRLISG